jgi:hypothetical protein
LHEELADPRATTLAMLRLTRTFAVQMVGNFGWLDTPAPKVTTALWFALWGSVVLAGLVLATPRRRLGLVAALGAVIAAPIALQIPVAVSAGIVWQGRYTLPLMVGVPVIAAACVSGAMYKATRVNASVVRAATGVAIVAHVLAFYWAARRYAVGLEGPLLTSEPAWRSPISFLPAVGLYTATMLCLGWFVWSAVRSRPDTDPMVVDG